MGRSLQTLRALAAANAARIAELGNWPVWMRDDHSIQASITGRIPTDEQTSSGMDAGLAAALGIIPEGAQHLSAVLHGAYTEQAVMQIREEAKRFMRDDISDAELEELASLETVYWLNACAVCKEENVDVRMFLEQVAALEGLMADPAARLATARVEFVAMQKKFSIVDGIPFVIQDGGLQGAYVLGHDWGVQLMHNIFFVGTFRPSLGLEEFPFSDLKDGEGRPKSGPVHGSRQFVKAAHVAELAAIIDVVRKHFG